MPAPDPRQVDLETAGRVVEILDAHECPRCGFPGMRGLHRQIGCDPRMVARHRRRRVAWHDLMVWVRYRLNEMLERDISYREPCEYAQVRALLERARRCPGPGLP